MERRAFLLALAAGTLAGVSGCSSQIRSGAARPISGVQADSWTATESLTSPDSPNPAGSPTPIDDPSSLAPVIAQDSPSSAALLTPPAAAVVLDEGPAPPPSFDVTLGAPPSFVNSLPGTARNVALTIDDGASSAVVKAYLDFAEASGVRLTFFVNGFYPSWTENAAQLRPLIDRGQVQLASHTWSHPDITSLSTRALAAELARNEQFLNNTFGVTAKPFFRPPYGYHNNRTDAICADAGLTTITLWYGSFGDSGLLTEAQLLSLANQWLGKQRIVIGHANHPTVTTLYPQLLELIRNRALQTVTLDDAFYGANGRLPHPAAVISG